MSAGQLHVGAAGRGTAARTRDPGRPAARAEAAERPAARHRIGIRELRQHASVYVDLAEKGYTVDITNRGRLVAQLVPVREPGSPLERLIAAGIIEPAGRTEHACDAGFGRDVGHVVVEAQRQILARRPASSPS